MPTEYSLCEHRAFHLLAVLSLAAAATLYVRCFVKAWIKGIKVFTVQLILQPSERFPEPLEMDDLSLS